MGGSETDLGMPPAAPETALRGRNFVVAQALSWGILAAGLVWLAPRGVSSPGWLLAPLAVLLFTCLLGVVTGLLQAFVVCATVLATAWLQNTGRLAPGAAAGAWLQAAVVGGVVVGTALCGVLLHKTLRSALLVEDAQNELLDTQTRALRHRERLLRHALRVDTVGEVSAMVVHQLRNQFQLIMGHAAAGIRDGDEEAEPHFQGIVATLKDSNELMESLLGLARSSSDRLRQIDLGDACESFGRRYGPLLPATVGLEMERGPGPLPVWMDIQGLDHALLNLVINARQAMENEGTITLRVRRGEDGDAQLQVRDTGPGIPEEVVAEVFKPFFTTKPVGQGTGLGLAAVHRFAVASNGSVTVANEAGAGACFTFRFPVAEEGRAASGIMDRAAKAREQKAIG